VGKGKGKGETLSRDMLDVELKEASCKDVAPLLDPELMETS
jgi:hypothetical protein